MTPQSILRVRPEPTPDRAHVPPPPLPRRCDQCQELHAPSVLFTVPPSTRWGATRLLCQWCLGLPQAQDETRSDTPRIAAHWTRGASRA